MIAADDGFLANPNSVLDAKATGFATDKDVFEAVRTNPNLALLDGTDSQDDSRPAPTIDNKRFKPMDVTVINPATGRTKTVTVIGVLSLKVSSDISGGVYSSAGLDLTVLRAWIAEHGTLEAYPDAQHVSNSADLC